MNLEQQVMQLQQASTNVVVVDGLRTARDAHQKIMGEMDIDKIDEIKDVNLKLVWDPPWSKDKMSDAAKLELNL